MTKFIWIYPYFILPCTLILYKILVALLLRLIRICRNGKHISESRLRKESGYVGGGDPLSGGAVSAAGLGIIRTC